MIGVELAGQLLDFNARIDSPDRAHQQLEGAVALHNILEREGIAYLADEVGMGKTLVALGAVALFRHFQPRFRLLIIAPRENIQRKWAKELRVFAGHNVRFPDLRVRGLGEGPARPLVHVPGLMALLRETSLDPERDFLCRLPSFSFQMGESDDDWTRVRTQLRAHLPWLADEALDLRGHRQRKDNLARAVCCGLPTFDLVIVDEAHNLKHGFSEAASARNRVLALALGHPAGGTDLKRFPSYGIRARKVLLLSATPIEESYRQLWNQLDVFGRGDKYPELADDQLGEEAKKNVAARFLIRRVTTIRTGTEELTKNQYRREWRRGGVLDHDEPVRIEDDRQRLTLALVQKKVSELLGSTKFNNRFQIGMLASFESFLETAKLKEAPEEASNFDDSDQAEDSGEREGIDVHDLNRLARSHVQKFGKQMPHPKMDALVQDLARSWNTGRKALVFVRRVASVKEILIKLEESYDDWLMHRLHDELPDAVRARFAQACDRYRAERLDADPTRAEEGGTFYSWYFHGEGPRGILSGANIQRRFTQTGAVYSTFFEDNDVAAILGVQPGAVIAELVRVLELPVSDLREKIRTRAMRFLGRAKKVARADRFLAAQAAAVELLVETLGPWQADAQVVWNARFRALNRPRTGEAPDIADYLEMPTFFSELRLRPALRAALWPVSADRTPEARFREALLRAQLLASAARLGHAFLDFYVLTIQRIGSLEPRAQQDDDEATDRDGIVAYLDLLETQQARAVADRGWRAYDELSTIASNFQLIIDVNAPDLRVAALDAIPRKVGELLGEQHPIGGMSGTVNQTLVRQFRMPGYPFALITTDLLQEGEDLHPFCSAVYHYGISWTPSAMEQRIGRIDRVRSQTDRHLSGRAEATQGTDLLQVYFPHLEDSVEVLQVRRVLTRMNTFLRLMHQGLGTPGTEARRLDVSREMVSGLPPLELITQRLTTAFPIDPADLKGDRTTKGLAVTPQHAHDALARFRTVREMTTTHAGASIRWDADAPEAAAFGTVTLGARTQPFALYLRTFADQLVVRCVSPVGRVAPDENADDVKALARKLGARIGAVSLDEERSYDLTVEDVVLLRAPTADRVRLGRLIDRVTRSADRVELEMLQSDLPLSTFQDDLRQERSLVLDV